MTEAAGRWALAFEQRTDLSSAQGSAAAVVAALRRGADLRLYMTTDSYEETLYFQQTYVRLAAEEGGEAVVLSAFRALLKVRGERVLRE